MFTLLRCITIDKKTLIASMCEEKPTRKLSRERQLLCPNCHNPVIFRSGKIMRPHFAHYQSECVVTNYEPETASHIQGKEVLYEWLKGKYPTADIEYEVYIPETKQIADIFVKHVDKGMEGVRWAFEFQHSSLSTIDWQSRHELYKSVGIQDFWILDKAKYMRFSKAQDITNARIRSDLEVTIYNKTGLCYFLDLESLELYIDFKFITSWHSIVVRGVRRQNEYTYHQPIHHSINLDKVKVRMNDEFKYGVLFYRKIEKQMKERLSWILASLRAEKAKKDEQELQEKAQEKRKFAINKYGKENIDDIWRFMKNNKERITKDVRNLSEEEFFMKYDPFIEKLLLDIEAYTVLENNKDLINRLLVSLTYMSDLFSINFLNEQENHTLEDYLRIVHREKVDLVNYVYEKYNEELEKLATMNFKMIKRKLDKIRPYITPWEETPTAIDYAVRYGRLDTKEEADEYMKKVKDRIINFNPFIDIEDL